jgi:sterol desaturase/sphingolipid hydroxylase (fatty acid hydroxylase superfamily)
MQAEVRMAADSNDYCSPMRLLFRYGFFPILFTGALAAGMALMRNGVAPMFAVSGITLATAGAIALAERIQPRFVSWGVSRGDIPTDLAHTIFSTLLPPEIIRAATIGVLTAGAIALSNLAGTSLWPSSIPLPLQLLFGMLLSEFGSYWAHRAMHESDVLWRLHAVHHSAERLYWLNAGRFHPLDTALQYLGQSIPLILLGAPAEIIALFSLWTAVHGMFQHANLDIRLGPLNWIFSMAELHRWHHSQLVEESNTNYGANVCFWDIVFGTRFLPVDREPPEEIGIADMPTVPTGFVAHLASPFRWDAVVREANE